jgi:hypothetical protein
MRCKLQVILIHLKSDRNSVSIKDDKLEVITNREIEAGEEVLISYLDVEKNAKDDEEAIMSRRVYLYKHFDFICRCSRCGTA